MPAALMMATVQAVLRAVVPQNAPAAALQRAARTLDRDLASRDCRGVAPRGAAVGSLLGRGLSGEDSILLDPGDVLIVYSDGLTQAEPPLLMDRSVLAALIDNTASAADIADRLIELGRAAGPLTDDLMIAVLRHSGPSPTTANGE